MNQRYEGSPCGIHRGAYTAKPNLPALEPRWLLLLKLTPWDAAKPRRNTPAKTLPDPWLILGDSVSDEILYLHI